MTRAGRASRPGRALAVAALLACGGCSADFTPRSVLDDLRVIAIVASPLEAGPSDDVTLSAVAIPPPGGAIAEQRWTFCPLSVGATAAYACAVPACEVALTPRADGSVVASPGALARACLATLLAQGTALPPDVPPELPPQLTTLFRFVAVSDDGTEREAVQRLTLYTTGDPPVRNHAPVITSVQVGGVDVLAGAAPPALVAGQSLPLRVLLDPSSAEPYVDAAGTSLVESLVVSFYTTDGRFDYDRASGPDAQVQLNGTSLDPALTQARLWVVARDLRGGEAVAGPFAIPVQR